MAEERRERSARTKIGDMFVNMEWPIAVVGG